jgi:predicted HicB family RNase H-like nuclease
MARPSAEEMFKNMIGRKDEDTAQSAQKTAAAPAAEEKKKASTVQVTVRLRPEQHKQLKAAAFHRDCDMSELVRQALDQFFA